MEFVPSAASTAGMNHVMLTRQVVLKLKLKHLLKHRCGQAYPSVDLALPGSVI